MTTTPCAEPDRAERAVYVFDLDNTLYPAGSTLYEDVGRRMTAFIQRALAMQEEQATQLREHYFHTYGATVIGMMRHHGIDGDAFMRDVHDVTLHDIAPDLALNAEINAIAGRKIVFTNGARDYAQRVLRAVGLSDAFDAVTSLEDLDFTPKPMRESFEAFCRLHGVDPCGAHFFDDHPENIATAAALGFHAHLVGPPGLSAKGRVAKPLLDVLRTLRSDNPAGMDT